MTLRISQPVSLALLCLAVSCTRSSKSGYPVILLAPISGQQAALGVQIDRSRAMVEKELKDAHNDTVAIYEIDSASQPTVANAEVQRALNQYKAHFLVGSILSGETRNFLQDVLQRNVVVLANGSSDPAIRYLPYRHTNDGFFRNWPPDDVEGREMAEFAYTTRHVTKLAVYCADDAYARALTTTFVRRYRDLGGSANDPQIYPTSATSFESVLARVDGSTVDGYYVVGLPRDLAGMYNTIRGSVKTKNKPVFSAVAAETAEFQALINKPLNDLYYTAPSTDFTSSQYFAFKEAYRKMFKGETPDVVAAITYDALHIMIAAIQKSMNDPAGAKAYLYSMPLYQGATGPTKFDNMGDVISKGVAIHFYESGVRRLAVAPGPVH